MLLYGAGGHAKVILSCIVANGNCVRAAFDDDQNRKEFAGIKIHEYYNSELFKSEFLVIAIGNNRIRRLLSQKIKHSFGTVIHPSATVDPEVILAPGSVVLHGSCIQTGSVIGNHVIINTRVSVNHDCFIGDFVHLAPGVMLCGNVKIGENTFLGAGSIVSPNLTIGSNCIIAAGSVITKHIPDGSTVRGNPGRIIRTAQ